MGAASILDPDTLPLPSSDALAVRLHPPAERAVRAGHPWVFENSIRSVSPTGQTADQPGSGDVAVIFDRKGRFLAVGLFDPTSPIRIRVLSHGEPAQVGPELFRTFLGEALERRKPLDDDPETTGYRVLHGEGDRFPGLVLDRYGDAVVLKLYSPIWLPRLREVVPAVRECLAPRTIVGLVSRRLAEDPGCPAPLRRGAVLDGAADSGPFEFQESGLHFEAHPVVGHKTGFYLDQRENRRRVEGETAGERVLNVFSYTGAFSLYAARGGAREVTSVDQSRPALRQADRHFALNASVARGTTHRAVEGDAFEVMEELARQGERFGVVVVDPPSFAKEASQVEGALGAYAALTGRALSLLDSGGLLVQASCSSRVQADDFFGRVHRAVADAGRSLQEEHRTEHPLDHPATFPEGHYLKCLFARVD